MYRRNLKLQLFTMVALLAGGCAGGAVRQSGSVNSAQTLYETGQKAHRSGDTTRAEQYLLAALERGYPVEKVFPALLETCIVGDRYDTALHYARARLIRTPDDAGLRYLVASLHLAAGQPSRARQEVEQLIADHPSLPEPNFLLGVIGRDHTYDGPSALRSFRRYLALAPTGPHAAEARRYLRSTRNSRSQEGGSR